MMMMLMIKENVNDWQFQNPKKVQNLFLTITLWSLKKLQMLDFFEGEIKGKIVQDCLLKENCLQGEPTAT